MRNQSAYLTSSLGNDLLNALCGEELALLVPHLREQEVVPRQRLYAPGDEVTHAYFPCGGTVVSLLVTLDGGHSVDVGVVGREGAIGGIVSQGKLYAFARAEVQLAGLILRIPTKALEGAKLRSPVIQGLFARYADCLLAEVFQGVACSATHSIEQRTAKWFLDAMHRTGGHEFPLTQDQIAVMMGVGRSYFTRVVKSLRGQGVIETRRGRICVTDRDALQQKACACNAVFRSHVNMVLKGVYAAPPGEHDC
jgi:CRP-like cAMP-binding protein